MSELAKFSVENYDYKRNLLFTGPTGTGKTFTAEGILKKFPGEGVHEKIRTYSVSDAKFKQFVKSNMLTLRKPEDYKSGLDNYPLEMMLRVKVLLYDDIGVSDTSEAYLRDFTFIIDERIKKGLTTIFTTNLKQDELKEKLNERIVSRILFNTDVIVMDGKDRRSETTNYFKI